MLPGCNRTYTTASVAGQCIRRVLDTDAKRIHPVQPVRQQGGAPEADPSRSRGVVGAWKDVRSRPQGSEAAWKGAPVVPGWPDAVDLPEGKARIREFVCMRIPVPHLSRYYFANIEEQARAGDGGGEHRQAAGMDRRGADRPDAADHAEGAAPVEPGGDDQGRDQAAGAGRGRGRGAEAADRHRGVAGVGVGDRGGGGRGRQDPHAVLHEGGDQAAGAGEEREHDDAAAARPEARGARDPRAPRERLLLPPARPHRPLGHRVLPRPGAPRLPQRRAEARRVALAVLPGAARAAGQADPEEEGPEGGDEALGEAVIGFGKGGKGEVVTATCGLRTYTCTTATICTILHIHAQGPNRRCCEHPRCLD